MKVKAKTDVTTYMCGYKKKIFEEGKEYFGYKHDEIADCYIVMDEYNALATFSEERFKLNFEV